MEIFSSGAASIGIIGGADGPTAIFLTRIGSFPWLTLIFAAVALAAALLILKKRRK